MHFGFCLGLTSHVRHALKALVAEKQQQLEGEPDRIVPLRVTTMRSEMICKSVNRSAHSTSALSSIVTTLIGQMLMLRSRTALLVSHVM